MGQAAVFSGIVLDEHGAPARVSHVGGEACYVVDDAGFLRHIPAEKVDRQVLKVIQNNVLENREVVVESMLKYLGSEDLFAKAAVEASIGQMGQTMEQLYQTGLPEEARAWLGMLGFSVTIDIHGDVLNIHMPEATEEE